MALDNVWLHEGTQLRSLVDGETRSSGNPPPEPPPMLLGSSIAGNDSDWVAWDNLLSNNGANKGLALSRSYTGGSIVSNFMSTAAAPDVARGVASMWSCKPPLASVNNGSLDSTFTSFFNSIPAGHRAFLMMWHEPWDDSFNWTDYKNAQARVWGLLNDSNADRDLVTWGILGTSFDFQQGRQSNFFPAGGQYDWVGADGYDFYRPPGAAADPRGRENYRRPNQIFGATVNFAASVDKPVVVGEFSFHPDPAYPTGPSNSEGVPARPNRLQAMVDYFTDNNVIAASMFHSSNGDSGPWWMDCFHNWSNKNDRSNTDTATINKIRELLATYGRQILQ